MNKTVKRIVTALSTAAVVVMMLIYLPVAAILPVLIALSALVQLEFSQIVAKKSEIMVWPGVAAGTLYLVSSLYFYDSCFVQIFFVLALIALFGKYKKPAVALGTTMLGFVYIPMMLRYFMIIPREHGMMMLLYVIAIVKISDMGGFAFGLSSAKLMKGGNHRMCPSISPNKSWEGMFGSVFGSCLVSTLFMPITHFALPKALAFGVAAAVIGTLGDLVESRFKREAEVKDSATFMPAGLGGFLDMFDSLVFAPALLYPFL